MPHPDYSIVDVPLRLDQVFALMCLIDNEVASGRGSAEYWAGPMAGLLGEIPQDRPHLRPGPAHWLYAELSRNR